MPQVSPVLKDVLDDVSSGKIQLPDFQRPWKWDDERIKALLATITLSYPMGVVMTLETGGEAQFRARPLTGVKVDPDIPAEQLLLDGQQRLTSLYQAMRSDQPVETVDSRGKNIQRWYYIKIADAVREGVDREDVIISVPADRMLREDFGRKITLDLSTPEHESAEGYFPLNIALDANRTTAWQRRYVSHVAQPGSDRWDIWAKFHDTILAEALAYQVPLIQLKHETPKEAVCSVFERVNTGGVVLTVFELLTATYAGNRAYAAEHGNDFSLADYWTEVKTRLCAAHPVLGAISEKEESGLTNVDFLQAIALVATREGPGATGCKRRDLLKLPLEAFLRWAPVVEEAFDWVGGFLTRQCVFRSEDVPYRTQLVPLAAIRALLGNGLAHQTEDLIAEWYWCGVFGELYGGSLESRFARDVDQMIDALRGEDPRQLIVLEQPDTMFEATFQEQRLESMASRNSAAYKGAYALLIKLGAVDWFFTEAPITRDLVLSQSVDIRQIFPRNFFDRRGGQPSWAASIVNKTPMSLRASRNVSGAPSKYLGQSARAAGIHEAWMEDVLRTHLIDPKTLYADDFEAFWEARVTEMLKMIAAAMGKPVFRTDGTRLAGE